MSWQNIAANVLFVAVTPFILIFHSILYILHWIVWPFLLVASAAKSTALIPFHFLAQFEALYYFLLTSIILGSTLGLTLHLTTNLLTSLFNLSPKPTSNPSPSPFPSQLNPPPEIPATGHTPQSYRTSRAERKRLDRLKSERRTLQAKLLVASQPFLSEVVKEARNQSPNANGSGINLLLKDQPVSGSGLEMSHTATEATRTGLFRDIILEQTDEEESDESMF